LLKKKGLVTDQEIQAIVDNWHGNRREEDLDPEVVRKEVKKEQKFENTVFPR